VPPDLRLWAARRTKARSCRTHPAYTRLTATSRTRSGSAASTPPPTQAGPDTTIRARASLPLDTGRRILERDVLARAGGLGVARRLGGGGARRRAVLEVDVLDLDRDAPLARTRLVRARL